MESTAMETQTETNLEGPPETRRRSAVAGDGVAGCGRRAVAGAPRPRFGRGRRPGGAAAGGRAGVRPGRPTGRAGRRPALPPAVASEAIPDGLRRCGGRVVVPAVHGRPAEAGVLPLVPRREHAPGANADDGPRAAVDAPAPARRILRDVLRPAHAGLRVDLFPRHVPDVPAGGLAAAADVGAAAAVRGGGVRHALPRRGGDDRRRLRSARRRDASRAPLVPPDVADGPEPPGDDAAGVDAGVGRAAVAACLFRTAARVGGGAGAAAGWLAITRPVDSFSFAVPVGLAVLLGLRGRPFSERARFFAPHFSRRRRSSRSSSSWTTASPGGGSRRPTATTSSGTTRSSSSASARSTPRYGPKPTCRKRSCTTTSGSRRSSTGTACAGRCTTWFGNGRGR